MKVQNIDLSFLYQERIKKTPKWLGWLVLSIGILVLGFVILIAVNDVGNEQLTQPIPTPTPTIVLEQKEEELLEIEIIRNKWVEANNNLDAAGDKDTLLQPPIIELNLSLDE